MSCRDKEGGTHFFACDCREDYFREERKRMRQAFASIVDLIDYKGRKTFIPANEKNILEICRAFTLGRSFNKKN